MKRLCLLLVLVTFFSSCKKENEMTINATITGLKKGTVYLQKITDSTLVNLDSVAINGNENFELSAIIDSPELLYIYVDKVDGTEFNDRVPFFAEKGDIIFKTHLDKLNSEVSFSGAKHQKVFQKYNKTMKGINKAVSQANVEFIQAQMNDDGDAIVSTDAKLNKLMASKYLRAIQFALNNKRSPVAAYIGAREIPEANTKYLDSIYNGLSEKSKNSIYGKELKHILDSRKENN